MEIYYDRKVWGYKIKEDGNKDKFDKDSLSNEDVKEILDKYIPIHPIGNGAYDWLERFGRHSLNSFIYLEPRTEYKDENDGKVKTGRARLCILIDGEVAGKGGYVWIGIDEKDFNILVADGMPFAS